MRKVSCLLFEMLAPEVWHFSPPAVAFNFKRGDLTKGLSSCDTLINTHHFNHVVSLVVPNTLCVPDYVTELLNDDSDYYIVKNINIAEFVNKEFIETFVKQGQLTVLSDNTLIDVEDCMCVTPAGDLVLSLLRDSYVALGLEGSPSKFSTPKPSRYIVKIDLKNPNFTPGNKLYERTCECLQNNFKKLMNVLLIWEPPDDSICPSSVAAYLNGRDYTVVACKTQVCKRLDYEVEVPAFPSSEAETEDEEGAIHELLEWLGAFSIGANLKPKGPENYVSLYDTPDPKMVIGQVTHIKWSGLFSSLRIQHFCQKIREYASTRKIQPWLSVHVQGFADSPVSWGLREHSYFTDGDNSFTLLLSSTNFIVCSIWSSCRGPRKESRQKLQIRRGNKKKRDT